MTPAVVDKPGVLTKPFDFVTDDVADLFPGVH
jgi:hypothetical protein